MNGNLWYALFLSTNFPHVEGVINPKIISVQNERLIQTVDCEAITDGS